MVLYSYFVYNKNDLICIEIIVYYILSITMWDLFCLSLSISFLSFLTIRFFI